jgi:hypothetical protein
VDSCRGTCLLRSAITLFLSQFFSRTRALALWVWDESSPYQRGLAFLLFTLEKRRYPRAASHQRKGNSVEIEVLAAAVAVLPAGAGLRPRLSVHKAGDSRRSIRRL